MSASVYACWICRVPVEVPPQGEVYLAVSGTIVCRSCREWASGLVRSRKLELEIAEKAMSCWRERRSNRAIAGGLEELWEVCKRLADLEELISLERERRRLAGL